MFSRAVICLLALGITIYFFGSLKVAEHSFAGGQR